MLRAYTLYTSEIDEIKLALEDIGDQLAKVTLLKKSVAIVTCHHDFINSGIVKALAAFLPFPIIGFTSFSQMTAKGTGLFDLSINILTSDDISFSMARSMQTAAERPASEITADVYERAMAGRAEKPALIISFLPMKLPCTGDAYLRSMDEVSGGVPHFGGAAMGEDEQGEDTYVIYQGEAIPDGCALLLLHGDVAFDCYFGNFLEDMLLERTAIVTRAEGACLQELDGKPFLEYLRRNGYDGSEAAKAGLLTIPFMFHYEGETALIARTLVDITDEGYGVFLAEIPEGVVFRTASITTDQIIRASRGVIEKAVAENGKATCFLVFACVGRYISLGLDNTSELECVKAAIPEGTPYMVCYVGGEVCPAHTADGFRNYYHNNSFIVCALGSAH